MLKQQPTVYQLLRTLALLIISGWLLLPPAGAATPEQAATNSAVTALRYISDPLEFVGDGHHGTLKAATGSTFTVTQDSFGGLVCNVAPNPAVPGADPSFWTLAFYMGTHATPHLGNYVARYAGTAGIALNVTGDGDSDEDIQGDFQVLELAYNPDGSVERFAVNFDQYESGATEGLHGQFRYNSTVGLQTEVRALTTSSEMYAEQDLANVYKLVRTGDTTQPLAVTYRLSTKDSDGYQPQPTFQTVTIPAGKASVQLVFDFTHLPSLPSGFTFTYKLKLQVPADHSYTVPRNQTVEVTFHQ